MKPEGILWETEHHRHFLRSPNRASFDILLGFILFSPTYRFTASSGELNPKRLRKQNPVTDKECILPIINANDTGRNLNSPA